MQPVPRIFVSATSRDLRTARGLVAEGLRRMECLPIVQDDFPPDYKTVRDMLRTKISTCNAVVHLAGFYYGAEPQPVLPGPDRRSFTQMEYEIAVELKLPCYVFLCGKAFPFDPHEPEPEDKQQLQLAHRNRLLQRDELFYEFASPEELANRTRELQLAVENLREELAKERSRRRLALGLAAAAVLIACVSGLWLMGRQRQQEGVIAAANAKLEAQGALIAQLLAEQDRLRAAMGGSGEEIRAQAEQNVAKARNQSVAEVRRGVQAAIAAAEKAVAAAKSDPAKLVPALKQLADAQQAAGHDNEAITALRQLVKLIGRDKQPAEWLRSTRELADAVKDRDTMSDEPESLLRDALAWAKQSTALGPEHPETLAAMDSLSRAIRWTPEKMAEHIALSREVAEIRERKLGPDHPDTLKALQALARQLSISAVEFKDAENGPASEKLFRQVIASNEKRLGPEHRETLMSELDLARSLRRRGKVAEARALYEKVIAIEEKTLGLDHEDTLGTIQVFAYFLSDEKDYAASIALARKALAAAEKSKGPEDRLTLTAIDTLVSQLLITKAPEHLDEAEKLARRAMDTRVRTVGPGQPDTLSSYDSVARILQRKGDEKGAKELRLRRLEEQGKVVGDDPSYARELFMEASRLYTVDDNQIALQLAERSLRIYDAKIPDGSAETADVLYLLSAIHGALDDRPEAEKAIRRAITLREKNNDDPESLAGSYLVLARTLVAEGKKLEALKPAHQAAAIFVKTSPAKDSSRTSAVKLAAQLEGEVGKVAEYAAFREKMSEKSDGKDWKEVRKTLEGSNDTRRHYLLGWVDPGVTDDTALQMLMHVDARGDEDGTFAFYYWKEGQLHSAKIVRKGSATGSNDVAKKVDIYNLSHGALLSWETITDDERSVEDSTAPGFSDIGKRLTAEVAELSRPVRQSLTEK